MLASWNVLIMNISIISIVAVSYYNNDDDNLQIVCLIVFSCSFCIFRKLFRHKCVFQRDCSPRYFVSATSWTRETGSEGLKD